MSLVPCRGCGEQIHHAAIRCPRCGASLPNAARYRVSLGLKLFLLALVLFMFFACGGPMMLYHGLYGVGN